MLYKYSTYTSSSTQYFDLSSLDLNCLNILIQMLSAILLRNCWISFFFFYCIYHFSVTQSIFTAQSIFKPQVKLIQDHKKDR